MCSCSSWAAQLAKSRKGRAEGINILRCARSARVLRAHSASGRRVPVHADVNSFRVMLPGKPHPQLPFEYEVGAAHLRHTQGQWGHCGDIRVWWPGRNRLMAASNGSARPKLPLNGYQDRVNR